jgi:hypothetical protein
MASKAEGRMIVRLEGNGWMIDHEGPVGEEMMELFGTKTIPSPFLKSTPVSQVIEVLKELNPLCEVLS